MTEQLPINAAATEQRIVEELTGKTPQVEQHHAPDSREAGDPVEPATPDDELQVGGRVEAEGPTLGED